ncbi:MAG TPA: ankyrin repeat domain-containing protein [Gemmatimonadaceae bacterium]
MPRRLPDRPSLEHLKKEAKALLHAARDKDPAALQRLAAALPAFADKSPDQIADVDIALHDAQSAVARQYGFPSWNALRDEVEARTLSFEEAIDQFVRAATGGARGRADRLLALYPKIASASFHTALVLGDADAAEAYLQSNPELAITTGGPQQWEPLMYVCHTCLHHDAPDRAAGLVAIARRLLALGASPNAEYHWNWHPELPRTVLWGAACPMRHLPLAEVLLQAGANPTDGVTTHIAAGTGAVEVLGLLHRYGMDVNGIPGGVPPLVYIMTFTTNPTGVRWLLEHGADPNLAWGPDAEAPLHVAARRWGVPMVEELVRRGADPLRRRADGCTPYTLAELYGNVEVASWLASHGARDELSPLQRFVAACARGDRSTAEAMLDERSDLRRSLGAEHHLLLQQPAESGNVAVLETMLACGFDPNVGDKDQVTPLHRAAMSGYADAVRVLLRFGADVNARDGMFAATPLVWAVEGRGHPRPGADHIAVARELIAAGSPVEWEPPEGAPGPERTLDGLMELRREVAATV